MIVFDASSLVSAAFGPGSVPDRAVRHAFQVDRVAVSEPVMAELLDVLHRPRLARFIDPEQRADLLDLLVLHPWRGIRVLRPAAYLAEAEAGR